MKCNGYRIPNIYRNLFLKAIKNNQIGTVEKLLSYKVGIDNSSFSDLHFALSLDNFKIAELLVKAGADINILNNDLLSKSRIEQELYFVNNPLEHLIVFTPLCLAVQKYRLDLVKLMLETGRAEPNKKCLYGGTALHFAAGNNDYLITKLLLKAGADPNLLNDEGVSPFQYAIGKNNHLVELMLKKRANPDQPDSKGNLPLHVVIAYANYETARLLLKYGANPNLVDGSGNTPLHIAIRFNDIELVNSLLYFNPDLTIQDRKNLTPIKLADNLGCHEILDMLKNYQSMKESFRNSHKYPGRFHNSAPKIKSSDRQTETDLDISDKKPRKRFDK